MSGILPGLCRQTSSGIDVRVRLTPRASSDRIDPPIAAADGQFHLAARVRAVPENGKANLALERLVAQWLSVPPSQVKVTGGATSRLKAVSVAGDPQRLASTLGGKLAGL